MSELPKGWEEVQIDSVTEIISGGTPKSSISEYYTDEHESGIAWITPADLSGYNNKLISHGRRSITQSGYDSCSAKLMPKGTVLFSSRAPIGYVVVAANKISTNQGFKSFVPYRGVNSDFLYYYLKSIKYLAESKATGTTFKELSGKVAKTLPFPLAPLPEQKRIVAKLEQVLAQVDTIKARLDGIPEILKRFRQSVLASAVSGKLTDEFAGERNHSSATKLKLVTTKIGSGSTPKGGQTAYKTEGIPLVRSMNIHSTFIKYEDLAFIDKTQAEKLKSVKIELDDVLLNITGASIGRVNLAPENFVGGRVNQHVSIIRCNRSILLPHYLHIYLASPKTQKWIEGENYGATRQALTKSMIESLELIIPSITEQKEIVRLVDQYFAFADSIETQVKKAQTRVDNLTQSILAKAFRGELVPQDPNDEPADKLLERIQQARAEAEELAKAAKKAAAAKKRAAKTAATK